MVEGRRRAPAGINGFLAKLDAAVSSLPSDEERKQIREAIDKIVDFLTALRRDFESLPSREETESIRQATKTVSAFMQKVEQDPTLSNVFGVRRPGRRPRATPHAVEPAKAKALLAELESLPVDEIRARLSNDARSMEELRGVAAEVGMRSTGRLGREALAHQIAMKIANFRGYRQLSGESPPE